LNQEKVIATLQNSSKIKDWSIDELNKLLSYYPYFQPARLWLTKLLHESDHPSYNSTLRFTSVLSIDRTFLYELIFKQPLREQIVSIEEAVTREDSVAEENPTTENLSIKEDKPVLDPIPLTQLGNKPSNQRVDELEMEILKHAMAASPIINPNEEINEATSQIMDDSEDTLLQNAGKQSFSKWLNKLNGPSEEPKKRVNKESNSTLIDRFISNNPQISKPTRSNFFKPADLAKLSLIEHEDFVTETLAKVYEQQGNLPRAVKIYEQLIVKYPEKKSYFAAQIFKLKEADK